VESAPTECQNAWPPGSYTTKLSSLTLPKAHLPFLSKDLLNTPTRAPLNLLIEIHKWQAKTFRQQWPDGGLAGPHESSDGNASQG
jgi:hypothetical protein